MAGRTVLKELAFDIDLKETLPLPECEVVAGDTGNVLKVTVTDGGTPVSLEGTYVTAVFASAAGTAIEDSDGGGVTLSGSTATICLYPGAIAPGHVACELQIYTSSEENPQSREDYDVLVTTARFGFDCREQMLNEEAVAALPETPLLTALIESVEQGEAERQAAEQQRQSLFEAMMASAGSGGGGVVTGTGAPTSATAAAAGMLYFDLTGKRLYVCTEVQEGSQWAELLPANGSANSLKVQRIATYTFANLPYGTVFTLQELTARLAGWYTKIDSKQDELTFDASPERNSTNPVTSGGIYTALHSGDWTTLADFELAEDSASIEVTARGEAYGGGAFSYDELCIYVCGCMTGGTAARLSLNGNMAGYMYFGSFMISDADAPENCCARLHLKKPVNGFAFAERLMGGDDGDEGHSSSTAVQGTCLKIDGLQKYTALKLAGNSAAIKFAAGTRVILMGRNV